MIKVDIPPIFESLTSLPLNCLSNQNWKNKIYKKIYFWLKSFFILKDISYNTIFAQINFIWKISGMIHFWHKLILFERYQLWYILTFLSFFFGEMGIYYPIPITLTIFITVVNFSQSQSQISAKSRETICKTNVVVTKRPV